MNTLLKVICAAAILLPAANNLMAQSYTMTVNTADGEKTQFATAQVESITIDEGEPASQSAFRKQHIGKNIVFLGHSIWRNDGYTVTYANSGTFTTPFSGSFKGVGYQTLIQRVLEFDSATRLGPNGGYSGYSLGGTSASDSKSVAWVAAQSNNGWTKVPNAIWTVDFITNDFKRNIPLGTLTDYKNNTGITTFYGAMRQLYEKIKYFSGTDVIIVFSNALPRNNSNYTSTSKNTVGCTLADYELAMLTVAALNQNWHFVDQNRLSGITDANLPAVTADGLHLNNMGYTMAVRPWIEVLSHLVW